MQATPMDEEDPELMQALLASEQGHEEEKRKRRQNLIDCIGGDFELITAGFEYLISIGKSTTEENVQRMLENDPKNFKKNILSIGGDRIDPIIPAPSVPNYSPKSTTIPRRSMPNLIDQLCNLITNRESKAKIEEFLNLYKITNLNQFASNGSLPIVYAVREGREDLIDLFIQRGVDVNFKTKKGNSPLFVALKERNVHRGRIVKFLLSKGANPDEVDVDGRNADDYADTITIQYWLKRARAAKIPEMMAVFQKVNIPRLAELYMSLVGQEIASDAIIQNIYGKRADPKASKKPIVLFLVGPPGHGKTQIAEDLMYTFGEKDTCRVNCGTIVDAKWGLFGSDSGYVGTTESTALANFIEQHDKKVGVVVLEEFEKMGDGAKEAFLHPFESGEWSIKKPGKSISADCSNIIFIMTSNLKNQEIINWLEQNKAIEKWNAAKDEKEKKTISTWIRTKLSALIKDDLMKGTVKEFARRVEVVPFVSFSTLEQKIIVETMEEKMASRYKHPPEGERIIGNIELHFSKKFNEKIVGEYHALEGASSLVAPVEKHIKEVAIEIEKRKPRPTHIWFYVHPEYDTRDFSLEDTEPKESTSQQTSDSNNNSKTEEEKPSNFFPSVSLQDDY